MAIRKYIVECILPRTDTKLEIFSAKTLEEVEKYCVKNIKYFPVLKIIGGSNKKVVGPDSYYERIIENPSYVDRKRDVVTDAKIGKLKKKTRFIHTIVYENDEKFCFLVKYKKSEARVCIVDIDMKEEIQSYIRTIQDHFKIKIYRGALPMVYFKHHAKLHTTIYELVTGSKLAGYVVFRDGNPYNYMRSNMIQGQRSNTHDKPKRGNQYYGVYVGNEPGRPKYVAMIRDSGKLKRVGRFHDPLLAAKAYDARRMEIFGRSGAKNFPYEYYKAFEPEYVKNVK